MNVPPFYKRQNEFINVGLSNIYRFLDPNREGRGFNVFAKFSDYRSTLRGIEFFFGRTRFRLELSLPPPFDHDKHFEIIVYMAKPVGNNDYAPEEVFTTTPVENLQFQFKDWLGNLCHYSHRESWIPRFFEVLHEKLVERKVPYVPVYTLENTIS